MGTPANRIEVNYDGLREISRQFDQESESIRAVIVQTNAKMDALVQSDWKGAGADAFYAEMQNIALPGCNRLVNALQSSADTLDQIMRIFQDGEAEESGLFKGGTGDGSSGLGKSGGAAPGDGSGAPDTQKEDSGPTGKFGLSLNESLHLKDCGKEKILYGEKDPNEAQGIADAKLGIWDGTASHKDGAKTSTLGGFPTSMKGEVKAGSGSVGIGLGVDSKGPVAGLFADGIAFSAEGSAAIGLGVAGLGVGVGGALKVLDVEAFAGYKDGQFGAKLGGDIVSAEGTVGVNVGGHNVGVSGKVGLGFELGFKLGPKIEVDLGPFEVGLEFGDQLGFASPK